MTKLYMRYIIVVIISTFLFSNISLAQGARKLDKNFSFVMTGNLDTVAAFSFETRVKRSGWGDFNGALTQAFVSKGFQVNSKENLSSKHSYAVIIDYGRGFFAGKMQYFDLKGQIIATNTNSEVVGTFAYDGRFNTDDISVAIADEIKNKNPVIVKEEYKKPEVVKNEPQFNNSGKSKEDRLRELKSLFEKELITKEEYEKAKQKILEEQ